MAAYSETEVFETFGKMLELLTEKSHYYWRNGKNLKDKEIPSDTRIAYDQTIATRTPYSEEAVRKIVERGSANLHLIFDTRSGQHFYLPPLDVDPKFIPSLTLDCNFKELKNKTCIALVLTKWDITKADYFEIGFRFEGERQKIEKKPPERHGYYHAQLFYKTRGGGGEFLKNCPSWLPTNAPSFPIMARDPISLLSSLLVSLYGKGMVNKLFDSHLFGSLGSRCKPTGLNELL